MKRSKKMILLLGMLAVCIGGYALINQMNQTESVTEEQGTFPLAEVTLDTLASMEWTSGEGTLRFIRKDGQWVKADDAAFPAKQDELDSLAENIIGLTAARELTDVQSLDDYGLEAPAFSLTFETTAGETITYAMGDATPFEDGYYLSMTGRDAIYTVTDSLADAFEKTVTELAQMEEMPEVETVTRITVGRSALEAGALDVELHEDGLWYMAGSAEALDSEDVEDLIDAITGLDWKTLAATHAQESDLIAYQLDDSAARVTLYDGEDEVFALLLGGEDESGSRYARLPESAMVYTLEADDVNTVLDANIETLWQKYPVTAAYEDLAGATFTFASGTVSIERAQEDEAQAEETADAEEADPDEELWKLVTDLRASSRTENLAGGEAVLIIRYETVSGQEKTVEVYDYDADSYIAPITDDAAMLIDAEDVDKLIRNLKQRL